MLELFRAQLSNLNLKSGIILTDNDHKYIEKISLFSPTKYHGLHGVKLVLSPEDFYLEY